MKVNSYTNIYFSPNGGSERIAGILRDSIIKDLGAEAQNLLCEEVDLLRSPLFKIKNIDSHNLTTVSIPVYAGRLPKPAVGSLQNLKGNGSPVIAVVVYGNRDYDDALLELTDLLRENGFYIVGAAAMIAEHSIFPQVAAGRPDQSDVKKIAGFVSDCTEVVNLLQEDLSEEKDSIAVKGNIPYKDPAPVPVKPQVSKRCNNCGICGTLCPVRAIDKANGAQYDKALCISCGACIKNCPQKARSFGGPIYAAGAMVFKKQCSVRREPEFFL